MEQMSDGRMEKHFGGKVEVMPDGKVKINGGKMEPNHHNISTNNDTSISTIRFDRSLESQDRQEPDVLDPTPKRSKLLLNPFRPKPKCEVCHRVFSNKTTLKIHSDNVHSGQAKPSCQNCLQKFKDKTSLANHTCISPEFEDVDVKEEEEGSEAIDVDHDKICPHSPNDIHWNDGEDDQSFLTASIGSQNGLHVESQNGESEFGELNGGGDSGGYVRSSFMGDRLLGRPQCELCYKTFASKKGLYKHKKFVKCQIEDRPNNNSNGPESKDESRNSVDKSDLESPDDGMVVTKPKPQCNLCQKTFVSNKCLNKHRKYVKCQERPPKDDGVFSFKCCYCDRSFKTEKYLNFHIEGSHMAISFKCDMCKKSFANRDTLKRHIGVVHNFKKNFECQECGKKYRTKPELSKHCVKHNHPCVLDCEKCQETFATYDEYTEHLKSESHSKVDLQCKYCFKVLGDSKTLARHIRRLHMDGKNFECQECSKKFLLKHELGSHCIQTKHTSTFHCERCSDTYPSYEDYKEHIAKVHPQREVSKIPKGDQLYLTDEDGNKYVECPECGKRFSHASGMRKHIKNVHMDLKEHVCHVCRHAFSDNSRLQNHIQTVHLKQRKFQCKICGKHLSERSKLKNHYRALHPDVDVNDYL